jgi:hypothetical protein
MLKGIDKMKMKGYNQKMMEKQKIISLGSYTHNIITSFYEEYKNEDIISTYLDWNAKDVLGHILFWMDHSGDKLYCMKKHLPVNKNSDTSAIKTNEEIYYKNKNIAIGIFFDKIKNAIFNYINVINLFTEEELFDKTLPTGFDGELWRYILLNLYIHPIMHPLHYYLKKGKYEKFAKIANNVYDNFMEYSNNNIKVFNFDIYYEDDLKKKEQISKLLEEKTNTEMIKKIIEVNME